MGISDAEFKQLMDEDAMWEARMAEEDAIRYYEEQQYYDSQEYLDYFRSLG